VQVAKRKATTEGEDQPAKKVKASATPAANGAPAPGSAAPGSAAATSEGPKKRGRPSNKEVRKAHHEGIIIPCLCDIQQRRLP